ncbi:Ribosomal protein L1p/L10e family [Hirschfeldia incana]|nr:Ribosomal protein L1p/L10e family [Hirschfeldia incana]
MTTTITAAPPPVYHSKIDSKNVNRALKSLLKWWDSKSNNPQSSEPLDNNSDDGGFVYLVVTLKKPPQIDRTNPVTIPLPHPLIDLTESPPEICLIIDDKHKNKITKETALKKIEAENVPITTVIKVSKLKTELKKLEEEEGMRHEVYFAERRLMPILPKLLGKEFVKKKKSLIAINLRNGNWKEQVEKVCESALFFVGTGTCSVVKVAKLSMGRKEIVENVVAVMEGIAGSIPGGWKSVKLFHLKLLESLALPVYELI